MVSEVVGVYRLRVMHNPLENYSRAQKPNRFRTSVKGKLRGVQQARPGRYLGHWVVGRVRPRERGGERGGERVGEGNLIGERRRWWWRERQEVRYTRATLIAPTTPKGSP